MINSLHHISISSASRCYFEHQQQFFGLNVRENTKIKNNFHQYTQNHSIKLFITHTLMDQLFGNDNEPGSQPKPKKGKTKQQYQAEKKRKQEQKNAIKKQQPSTKNEENKQGKGDKDGKVEQGEGAVKKRRDRGRNKKIKEEQKKAQEIKKSTREQYQLPLVIKIHRSIMETDDISMNIEDFIEFMYPEQKQKRTNRFNRNVIIKPYEKQDDEGNIEYKLKLIKPTEDRLDHLATQMKFRILEGFGEAYYRIGVEDDGKALGLDKQEMYESLKTICILANRNHADVTAIIVAQGIKGNIVELMVTKNPKQGVKLQIRLLLMGEPGSGKSTLLGVIKSGQNDNGKGSSRTKVFTHKDQFMSGITQTKSHHLIAFDSKGKLFNNKTMMSIQSWLENSSKILSFIDVGGHKEKQVVSSLCSFFPQYALWVVSAVNKTLNTSCIELAKIFNLPLIVVITHLDQLNMQGEMETIMRIKKILKELYPNKAPSVIKEMQNAVLFSRITSTEDVIPIFLISNVSGKNLDLLINFFNLLTSTSQLRNNQDLHSQFLISNKYNLEKNLVLAGTVIKGTIKKGQILHLGPDTKGSFRAVQVQSIECMRVPVLLAKCGQICTIGIKLLSYAKEWLQKQPNAIRRGMVLIQSKSNLKATHQFTASFFPYSSNSQQIKITAKYQPVVNTLTTRQICDIIIMGNNEFQEEPETPLMMTLKKKKSKSIDIFGKNKGGHHNCNSSSVSSLKIQLKKNATTEDKKQDEYMKIANKKKQSVDLTPTLKPNLNLSSLSTSLEQQSKQSPNSKKLLSTLQPIQQTKQQGKLKKKKIDRDVEIKFSSDQPTMLRLRFKYYPQYLENGQKLVINELKLIGKVVQLHY